VRVTRVKFVEFLQGKWLGHPLHPAIVHVPVGGWIVACVLDVIRWAGGGNEALARLALWCVGVGLVTAVLAVPPGIADWSAVKKGKPAWRLGLYHMILNLLAAVVWTVNLGLRLGSEPAGALTLPVLVTSLVATALVLVSAYLGSLMVFDQGVGVARFSKAKWRARAAAAGARLPEEK
jgi:uncharacterized membrane protein